MPSYPLSCCFPQVRFTSLSGYCLTKRNHPRDSSWLAVLTGSVEAGYARPLALPHLPSLHCPTHGWCHQVPLSHGLHHVVHAVATFSADSPHLRQFLVVPRRCSGGHMCLAVIVSFPVLHLTLFFKSTKSTWVEPISFG
jgi:hypothetical protein